MRTIIVEYPKPDTQQFHVFATRVLNQHINGHDLGLTLVGLLGFRLPLLLDIELVVPCWARLR